MRELANGALEAGYHEIAWDGAGRALATTWGSIPASFRDARRLVQLAEMLERAPGGDEAVVDLFHHVKGQDDEARALVSAWPTLRTGDAISPDDPMFHAVLPTPYLRDWLDALQTEEQDATVALMPWTRGPTDPGKHVRPAGHAMRSVGVGQ